MLDVRQIRADPEGTKAALARRGEEAVRDVDEFLAADAQRREVLARVEAARADRNAAAKAIAEAKQRGEDAAEAIARQAELKQQQAADEEALAEADAALGQVMLRIPNIPHPFAPPWGHRRGRRASAAGSRHPTGVWLPRARPSRHRRPRWAGADRPGGRSPRLG